LECGVDFGAIITVRHLSVNYFGAIFGVYFPDGAISRDGKIFLVKLLSQEAASQ
jgi:hypothetical protein